MAINWRRYTLVELEGPDETHYLLRKGWIFKKYMSFNSPGYWWSKSDSNFDYCVTKKRSKAMFYYNLMRKT
jgi:hypothetical protein